MRVPSSQLPMIGRSLVLCQSRAGYDEAPRRPQRSEGAGGEGGGQRRYNNTNTNRDGGRRDFNRSFDDGDERPQRSGYSGGEQRGDRPQRFGGGGGGGRFGGQREGGRGRGGYAPRGGDGEGGEGELRQGGYRQGGNRGGNPRSALTEEQLAARKEVNGAINAATSWRELAGVLATKGPQMDSENISVVLYKVSQDARPGEADRAEYDGLLGSLLGWVLALLPMFRPKHTALCLYALARMELYSAEVVGGLADKAATQLVNFTNNEVTNLILSLAKLGHKPSDTFMTEFWSRTAVRLEQMSRLELSNLVQGLSRLQLLPSPEWMEAFLKSAGRQANGMYRRDYITLAMWVATVAKDSGWQPSQAGVDALFTSNIGRLAPPPSDRPAAATASTDGEDAPAPPAAEAKGGWRGRDGKVGPVPKYATTVGVDMPDISRLLWSLSNFSARPSRPWFEALYGALSRQWRSWSSSELPTIATYLSRYLQQPATPDMCKQLANFLGSENVRANMGADGVGACLYLLAMSGFKPTDRWLDEQVIYLKGALPSASLAGLEAVYNALPLLGSGYRLNEVVTDAANRYNAAVNQQQSGSEELTSVA
eukprot:CAMPEP_0202868452 /NCGR_PEP_ID=MMETSP1391-20130828/10885_1 /ASSEMBLY_ACC=CAM_ASM_000867 /TAXON_ID=1034604 /ORGANISM="Chlamydomonas leiostraca, Strain SAG 11-49" /LENGTH=594 /DNA_ID=CAMNT_0049548627 /DNA_START=137 /DNA_END=1921 /DNA_ORIENTATION=+